MSPGSEHSPHLPSGTGRDCFWVKENLGAYDLWDDSLSQAEFGAIESHLQQCPACASEYADIRRAREVIEMTVAAVDRDAWEHEKEEFTSEILARLRDSGCFDGEEEASPMALPLAAPHLYEPAEPRQDDTRQEPMRGNRLLVMAASLFLMFALPVLALVVVREFLPTPTASESSAESHRERTTTNMQGPPMAHQGSDGPPVVTVAPNVDTLNGDPVTTETLDAVTEAKLRDFELAALLPSTEEEYEAWARKEYPHIMGLYDILTEVDEKDPNAVPLWNGVPVNIPAWGMRLYKDTSTDERPAGWRALLIYSGEIFKFDWPEEAGNPNCKPTLHALEQAAAVAGFNLQFDNDGVHCAPNLLYGDVYDGELHFLLKPLAGATVAWASPTQEVPEAYVASLVEDIPRARVVLGYLAISSSLVQASEFEALAQRALTLAGNFAELRSPVCDVSTRLSWFGDFLDTRGELLNLNWHGIARQD